MKREQSSSSDTPAPSRPAPRALGPWLGASLALAAASAAWAGFQWWELVVARRGGVTVCGVGGGSCAELWDSPFANAIHAWTGVPVAGWGVVFGGAAAGVALTALCTRQAARERWLAALLALAAAGLLGTLALVGVSLSMGSYCQTCAATYALTIAFAACAFGAARGVPSHRLAAGGGRAALALALGFGAALGPGGLTPSASAGPGAASVSTAAPDSSSGGDPADLDQRLAGYIASMQPRFQQALSDVLADYAAQPVVDMPPRRTRIGPASAPLRIAAWTDTLCPHCRQLHVTLGEIQALLGGAAWSLSPHQFPLDGRCNSEIEQRGSSDVRCLAARIQICAEGRSDEFQVASRLLENQDGLTESTALAIGAESIPAAELQGCLDAPATARKLEADVAFAAANGIQGTPFLLVNGRRSVAYPPLLYALALAGGDPAHPAFAVLPPAQPLPNRP